MKKPLLLAVHRYLGLITGLVFLVVAFTGVLLLYKSTILYSYYPSLAAEQKADLPEIETDLRVIERLWLEHNQAPVRQLRFPTQDWPFYEASYQSGERAYLSTKGELLVTSLGNDNPFAFILDLHHHLLAGHLGSEINGYIHLAVMLLLLTGIYAWWPRNWRKSLRLALGGSLIKLAYSWHRAMGALASLALILVVGTGVMMIFYSPVRAALVATLGGEVVNIDKRITPGTELQPWSRLHQTILTTLPEGQLRSINFPADGSEAVVARKRMPEEWHQNGRSFVYIDPYKNQAYGVIDARQAGLGLDLTQKIYPLHSGAVGGLPYLILLTFAGLTVVLLVPSGFYVWWWRHKRR